MRAVVQRVDGARVVVGERVTGQIETGLVVLLGVSTSDQPPDADWMARKIVSLRIFADADDKMNLSVADIGGGALVVSQFTLLGDARKGRRPSFIRAASGPDAETLYQSVARGIEDLGVRTATGEFGAMMRVELVNDGPVTILLDSTGEF